MLDGRLNQFKSTLCQVREVALALEFNRNGYSLGSSHIFRWQDMEIIDEDWPSGERSPRCT